MASYLSPPPLLLRFLTLPIDEREGTTTLVTPTEAVLFKPATQNVNEIKIKGLCEVRNAKSRFGGYVSSLEV